MPPDSTRRSGAASPSPSIASNSNFGHLALAAAADDDVPGRLSTSPSLALSTASELIESVRHLQRTEKVVRLEIERRSIREAIRTHDEMVQFVEEQLQYVADFKREWLSHMRGLELERQEEISREAYERQRVEEAWTAAVESVVTEFRSQYYSIANRGYSQHYTYPTSRSGIVAGPGMAVAMHRR
jgi:hypothetical protein